MTNPKTPGELLADNYFELQDKVAVVTGASSGLGRHFAEVLAAAGCKVALLARRIDRLEDLCQTIESQGGQALALQVDVCQPAEVDTAFATLGSKLGPVQVLVNNAGIGVTTRFLEPATAEDDRMMDVNQHAVWRVAQVAARQMVDAEVAGSIINIASILGLRVSAGTGGYAVSKAAVIHMTKVMALELARYNIRANAIAPGYFSTEMNAEMLASEQGQKIIKKVPMRRVGEYEELDGLLLLLASNRGSFMTGTVVPVDGGHLNSGLT